MSLMKGSVNNILEVVGKTPIVKLQSLAEDIPAEIYVKCEYLNPGGSMKDRIGIQIIEDAEKKGELREGGTIVEATSGNTGMGLALVAAIRGYKTIFVMPDKMSDEKIKALRAVGAKVVVCPTNVEPEDPRSYYSVSRKIAEETTNAFYANQYHNPSNPKAHYNSTGPEIWDQTQGEFDVFCAGMGTGGTLSGTGKFLKEKNPNIQIVGVDPIGSLYYDYFKTGQLTQAHPYKVEGIGEDFLPSTMNIKILDDVVQVNDKECFIIARDLVRKEGLLCGGSGGASVAGAIKYAKKVNKPIRILAHLPDHALRYLTKYLDDEWMRENGFLGPRPSLGKVSDILNMRSQKSIYTAQITDSIQYVIEQMKRYGISQLPIYDKEELVGILDEKDILSCLLEGSEISSQISSFVNKTFARASLETKVIDLNKLFNQSVSVVVFENKKLVGIITKIDLIEYMTKNIH